MATADPTPVLTGATDPTPVNQGRPAGRRLALEVWYRVAAIAIFIGAWQVVVWTGWKPQFLVPSPFTVLDVMVHHPGAFSSDAGVTFARAAAGMGAAVVLGLALGVVGSARPLRGPLRSLVAGLSTMPGVVWIPALLLVVGPSTAVLVFVMVAGSAPAIARGIIDGVTRGRAAGADPTVMAGGSGFDRLRHEVIPKALPDAIAGTRTGWAACWGALLAGEIILTLPSLGLGGQLVNQRGLNDPVAVYQVMILVFVLGVLVDGLVFGSLTRLVSRGRNPEHQLDATLA